MADIGPKKRSRDEVVKKTEVPKSNKAIITTTTYTPDHTSDDEDGIVSDRVIEFPSESKTNNKIKRSRHEYVIHSFVGSNIFINLVVVAVAVAIVRLQGVQ